MNYSLKFYQVILASFLCLFSSGCFFLVVGGVGAVGGYAVTRDTFEGVTSKGQDEILAAARKVLSIMGEIKDDDPKSGVIYAKVYGKDVRVTVIQINMTTSKLRVKARYGIFPRIGLAQDIFTKIMNQLE